MAAHVVSNPRGDSPVPTPPEGTTYLYEMVFDEGRGRAWADEPAELLDVLIPGYLDQSVEDQMTQRARLATSVRMITQAGLLAAQPEADLTPEQEAATNTSAPVDLRTWDAPVPLVVIDLAYAPNTENRLPEPVEGSQVLVLRAYDEQDFLADLHRAGHIVLARRDV